MRRVQPIQLHELDPSSYSSVSYSRSGLESEAKVQTLVIFLVMSAVEVLRLVVAEHEYLPDRPGLDQRGRDLLVFAAEDP